MKEDEEELAGDRAEDATLEISWEIRINRIEALISVVNHVEFTEHFSHGNSQSDIWYKAEPTILPPLREEQIVRKFMVRKHEGVIDRSTPNPSEENEDRPAQIILGN